MLGTGVLSDILQGAQLIPQFWCRQQVQQGQESDKTGVVQPHRGLVHFAVVGPYRQEACTYEFFQVGRKEKEL